MHCAACGYVKATHDLGTLKCHPATANVNGARGTWREPPPTDPALYPEIMRRDAEAGRKATEDARRPYEPEVTPPPLVPARAPQGPQEVAGGQGKQAVGLGRRATALGWLAEAAYWRAHDGTEGCAVRLAKGPLRAVATWQRKAGAKGWTTDIAYAWRTDADAVPTKLTLTQLEGIIE